MGLEMVEWVRLRLVPIAAAALLLISSRLAAYPLLSAWPPSIDFGDVPSGTTSAAKVVTVTNVSGGSIGPLTIAGGGLSGTFANSQTCQGATLAPGGTCQVNYTFTPPSPGPQSTTNSFTLDGEGYSIFLSGNGISGLSLAPLAHNFGTVGVGFTSPTLTTTVTNTTAGPIGPLTIAGGGLSGTFANSQTCQGATLAPGGTCQVNYTFTPPSGGPHSLVNSFTLNGAAFNVDLTGIGLSRISVGPSTISFGSWLVGTTSPAHDVIVTNVSGIPLGPLDVTGGVADAPFSAIEDCSGVTLAAAGVCRFSLRFAPTVAGLAAQSVALSINGEPFQIDLTGIGVDPPKAASIPALSPFAIPILVLMIVLVGAGRRREGSLRRSRRT